MQTTIFQEKTRLKEEPKLHIPTFIMVCNADGPIEVEN